MLLVYTRFLVFRHMKYACSKDCTNMNEYSLDIPYDH